MMIIAEVPHRVMIKETLKLQYTCSGLSLIRCTTVAIEICRLTSPQRSFTLLSVEQSLLTTRVQMSRWILIFGNAATVADLLANTIMHHRALGELYFSSK
jgi:hypothetical protein